jgi:hypothetical protein
VGGTSAQSSSSPAAQCANPSNGAVSMSPTSGTFKDSVSVSLSSSVSNAEIRYTTDGTAPTTSSTLYDGKALNFTATTRLRAQAYLNGNTAGTVSSALYVASDVTATHDLPVIVLDSYGSGKLPTDNALRTYVDVAFLQYDLNNGSAALSAKPTVASLAAFHVRGQSSAMFAKLPYRIELRDDSGGDRDCPILGLPSESDWALIASYPDTTLIHHAFTYSLGREIGLQAPRLANVEVYLNVEKRPLAAGDYQGVYQFVETIKNQKNRLNLKQLKDTDTTQPAITGGYIFKFNWMAAEEPLLPCPSGGANCWKDMELIDPDPVNQQQKDYITQQLVALNTALHGTNLSDPTSGYPAYIDVKSWVDTVIINEYTRNMDAYARSQYFYKDRDAKINAGPLWDFDLIAGVGMTPGGFGASFANTAADGWQYEANASRLANATADWFPVLIAEPNFKAQLIARWKELRAGVLSDSAINTRIDTVSKGMAAGADRNFAKWALLGKTSTGSAAGGPGTTMAPSFAIPSETTWSGQITYMKNWLQKRAAWLDTQWK